MAEKTKKQTTLIGVIFMLLAAIIWGTSFVAQSNGLSKIGNFTFLSFRSYLAVAALLPVSFVFYKTGKKKGPGVHNEYKKFFSKDLIIGGFFCGMALFAGTAFQQAGIHLAGVGKSGFLTTLYMLIVPLIGLVVFKRNVSPVLWICIATALTGMFFLCTEDKNSNPLGYVFLVLCAFCFSVQITLVDVYIEKVDGVRLSLMQFVFCSAISSFVMMYAEKPVYSVLVSCIFELFYAGVMSSAVAFTLQIIAQKNLSPVITTLLMSLESVFAAISGALFLDEEFAGKKLLGCCLVFSAVIISQLPWEKAIKSRKNKA